MQFDTALIFESIPEILTGMWVTLETLVLSIFFGGLLAIILLLMRLSNKTILVKFTKAYIYFFRGTPAIVQLFLIYNGLPQFDFIREGILWPILREPFACVVIALTLNTAAYVSEILRGGVLGVDKKLIESGKALGMNSRQCFIYITAPIAIRLILPAYSNEIISMLKTTALASMVTLMDMTGAARTISAETFATYEIYISIAIIYLIITWFIQQSFKFIENQLNKNISL